MFIRAQMITAVVVLAVCACATKDNKVELPNPVVARQPKVPDDVTQYVKRNLPALRFVTKEDYRADQYEYFSKDIRWAVDGDFDGNGVDDIAGIMVENSRTVLLMAFHRSAKGIRHYVLADNLGELPLGNTLRLQRAGLTWVSHADANETEYKKLKNPGIVEDLMETCHTMLHYWENGKYHSVYRGV
ncbi:MAG: hypothetical protein IT367_02130 [Candidatus Hydrogenedentes bacterium]|nr:hypothetical protein [Candidatus Hydrogenedentota bacterium]